MLITYICFFLYIIEQELQREKTYHLIYAPNEDSNQPRISMRIPQSDQILRGPHEETLHPWLSKKAPSEGSDQTAHMSEDTFF